MCLVLKSDNGKLGRLRLPMFRVPSAPLSGVACGAPNGFEKGDPFHEDTKYVLGFEIGQRESGFYSERTE